MANFIIKSKIPNGNHILEIERNTKIPDTTKNNILKFNTIQNANFSVVGLVKACAEDIANKFPGIDHSLLENASVILSKTISGLTASLWWTSFRTFCSCTDWMIAHSINVAMLSTIIAVKSKEQSENQYRICLGALLHDIGKLLIPKEIVQKPGKLSEKEISIMRRHCEIGYYVAQRINLPNDSADIVLQHHERMDGSGYPQCITADRIPRFSRIVMIADSIDAITSLRPYKDAENSKTGVDILLSEKSKFDPYYIGILLQCLRT
jgi:putative nucleotidyltransferase with HDIG domain